MEENRESTTCETPIPESEQRVESTEAGNASLADEQTGSTANVLSAGNAGMRVCAKCGNSVEEGQAFCPKCGQKVDLQSDTNVPPVVPAQYAATAQPKKKNTVIIVAVAVVVVIAVLAILLIPKLFVSVDKLCAQGEYEKAYEKASESEKTDVVFENLAAARCAVLINRGQGNGLVHFRLRNAYFYEYAKDDGEMVKWLVLYMDIATDSSTIPGVYCLVSWGVEDPEWADFAQVVDLEAESYGYYDTEDDEFWKILTRNIGREMIKETMKEGKKLSSAAIDRINGLYEDGKLGKVTELDID